MAEAILFNPVKFIEEVKARPGLYDPAHPMDRNERLDLWKEVGAVLFPDWDTCTKATAYDRVLQMQKKWRSFRDAYNRELRTRKSETGNKISRKIYCYFKRMTFLGGFEGEITVSESSDVEEQQKPLYSMHDVEQSNTKADDDDYQPIKAEISKRQKPPKKTKVKRRRSSSSNIQPTEEYEIPMPMFSSTEVTDNVNDFDSDKLFLMSFAPEMRHLPMHIKMWARSQIANVMQEAVNSFCNNTMPQTYGGNERKRKTRTYDDLSE